MSGIPNQQLVQRGLDITALYPANASDLINQLNYLKHQHKFEILGNKSNPDYWNRFTIVKHADCKKTYSQNFLLCLIAKFVSPSDILPLYVVTKSDKLFFVARNCCESMKKLCEAKLLLPNPLEPEYPFTIIIIKHFVSIRSLPIVNVEKNIKNVLNKRLRNGLLDLTKFHEDQDLEEFCPLFQPKVLLYILSLATKFRNVFKIVLCNNDIQKLPNFESLDYKKFKDIDLSSNMIQKIEDIVPLKDFTHITSLRLDDNPLCGCFDDCHTYFLYVKTICKKLETLDTKRLYENGWIKEHKTFLCSETGYNFASQFIENYYTNFDDSLRMDFGSFYHEDAMFSLTHAFYKKLKKNRFFPVPSTWLYPEMHNGFNFFQKQNRNLLTDIRDDNCLIIGRPAIELMFQRYFPPIKHNPHTFCVDLMYYTKKSAIITVTGIFEDSKELIPGRITCSFLRTFALTSSDGKEWLITNDQWNIYAPYRLQNSLPPMPNKNEEMCTFPRPNENKTEELEALTRTFQSITEMTYQHSKKLVRFLLRNGWSLKLALEVFMDKHINNEIPDDAFEKKSCTKENKDSSDDEIIGLENDMLPSITKLLEDLTPPAPSCTNYSKTEN